MSIKIVLRDLEPLLRAKVLKYTTEPLLPPGENYGSTIFRVNLVIQKSGQEETLNLVAKMLPSSEYQRTIFDSPFTFKKEIFFYRELIPAYQKLERDFGFKEHEIIDVLPKFYGARLSLNEAEVDKVDDDAVILMDNLLAKGFHLGNRREGNLRSIQKVTKI